MSNDLAQIDPTTLRVQPGARGLLWTGEAGQWWVVLAQIDPTTLRVQPGARGLLWTGEAGQWWVVALDDYRRLAGPFVDLESASAALTRGPA